MRTYPVYEFIHRICDIMFLNQIKKVKSSWLKYDILYDYYKITNSYCDCIYVYVIINGYKAIYTTADGILDKGIERLENFNFIQDFTKKDLYHLKISSMKALNHVVL